MLVSVLCLHLLDHVLDHPALHNGWNGDMYQAEAPHMLRDQLLDVYSDILQRTSFPMSRWVAAPRWFGSKLCAITVLPFWKLFNARSHIPCDFLFLKLTILGLHDGRKLGIVCALLAQYSLAQRSLLNVVKNSTKELPRGHWQQSGGFRLIRHRAEKRKS
jgi:hypothetical protein